MVGWSFPIHMHTSSYLPGRTSGAGEADGDDGLDIAAHLHLLWRNRVLLVVCALLAGIGSLALAWFAPRVYVAEAAMAVSRPKIGEAQAAGDLATANFRPLIESRAIAAQVIKDTGLDRPPYNVSPDTFFKSLVEITEVRASSIIMVTGRMGDPALAARVVNRVAELGVETARRVSQQEARQIRDDLKLQLDESQARLAAAVNTLETTRVASQLELVRSDVKSAITEREKLLALVISIETEKTRLARIEQELGKRNRIETVKRSIDSDPATMEAARTLETKPRELLNLQIQNEVLSTVYADLDREAALTRSKLAGMERAKAQMDARQLSSASLASLNALYAKEALVSRLETERDLANDSYKDLAKSYATARLMVIGRTSALQVLSTAIPPDSAESRRLPRALLIGATSGLLLAALLLLVVHAFRAEERRPRGSRV